MLDDYEVSKSTLALISLDNRVTCVYEEDDQYHVLMNSNQIIENACQYFGSSYDGRLRGTKSLIGVNYKAPIIVEESQNMIFFPTNSPRSQICHWISLHQIKDYHKKDAHHVRVVFHNGREIIVNMSYSSFENQVLRATRLDAVLNQRKTLSKTVI